MRIYAGEPVDGRVAESVKIGDPLTLVIGIDQQVSISPMFYEQLLRVPILKAQKRLTT